MTTTTYRPVFDRYLPNCVMERDPIEVANAIAFVWGLDLGAGENGRIVVMAQMPHHLWHAVYEVVGQGDGLTGLIARARELPCPTPDRVMAGPDVMNRDVTSGQRPWDVLKDAGLRPAAVVTSLRTGLGYIREKLTTDPGMCYLTISARCNRLIEDMAHYAVKPSPGGGLEPVQHQYSHGVDSLRYALQPTLGSRMHDPHRN